MKKWIGLILVFTVLAGLCPAALAAETATYQLGDKMEDFTAQLSDGTEISLYGLLAEKKAVLINFWASWCGPCRVEFPYMEQAYNEMSDEIGVIALSVEPSDSNEAIEAFKAELGISALPMGRDDSNIGLRFAINSIPLSVMVDRNGVICFMEAGSVTDKDKFLRLFKVFTGDDYADPILLEEMPKAMPDVEMPAPEVLGAALGVEGGAMEVTIPEGTQVWPFVPAEDGSYAMATNGSVKETSAAFGVEVTAEAGQALAFQYSVDCDPLSNSLRVDVDDQAAHVLGGRLDWTDAYVSFDEAGVHHVSFTYDRGTSDGDTGAMLRGLRLVSAQEAAMLDAVKPAGPAKVLSGYTADVEIVAGDFKEAVMTASGVEETSPGMNVMQADALTLRIRIGDEVQDNLAFITVNEAYYMLSSLEQDEQGYLFTFNRDHSAESLLPVHVLMVYGSAEDVYGDALAGAQWYQSEAELDAFIELVQDMFASSGETAEIAWHYTDGSAKQSESEQAAEALDDGMGRYVMTVTDEDGQPVAGVMLQICDEGTCMVAATDEAGMVTHIANRYPYEIHVLKAPEGYEGVSDVFTFPEEGGELLIQLKKQ